MNGKSKPVKAVGRSEIFPGGSVRGKTTGSARWWREHKTRVERRRTALVLKVGIPDFHDEARGCGLEDASCVEEPPDPPRRLAASNAGGQRVYMS